MSKRLGVTLVLALLSTPPCVADLTELVARLRQEPMSLFDWGMVQLERDLQQARRDDRDFLRVDYQPGNERIMIDASFVVLPEEIKAISAEKACYARYHAIKFSHQDPEAMKRQPDIAALGTELMKSIFIRVGISSEKMEFPFSPDMRCHGRLMSQEVAYTPGDTR